MEIEKLTTKDIEQRAYKLLFSIIEIVYFNHDFHLKNPEINLAKDGSIDLEWRNGEVILLINILKKKIFEAHCYGDNGKGNKIKGIYRSYDIKEDLIEWIALNFKK